MPKPKQVVLVYKFPIPKTKKIVFQDLFRTEDAPSKEHLSKTTYLRGELEKALETGRADVIQTACEAYLPQLMGFIVAVEANTTLRLNKPLSMPFFLLCFQSFVFLVCDFLHYFIILFFSYYFRFWVDFCNWGRWKISKVLSKLHLQIRSSYGSIGKIIFKNWRKNWTENEKDEWIKKKMNEQKTWRTTKTTE